MGPRRLSGGMGRNLSTFCCNSFGIPVPRPPFPPGSSSPARGPGERGGVSAGLCARLCGRGPDARRIDLTRSNPSRAAGGGAESELPEVSGRALNLKPPLLQPPPGPVPWPAPSAPLGSLRARPSPPDPRLLPRAAVRPGNAQFQLRDIAKCKSPAAVQVPLP